MKKLLIILILFPVLSGYAQIGGQHAYDFLNLTPPARIAALGGVNISTMDNDVTLAWQNPALLNDSMHQHLSLSAVNYFADIVFGYAAYSHTFENVGSFHTGIQYVGYGEFKEADEYGNITGTFGANDLAWTIGFARNIGRFRYGTNLKLINSNIAGFNSFAMAVDLGGSYRSADQLFSAGVVMKNLGLQLSKYTPTGEREPLPFEIQAGVSYKLKYMPMRFSATVTNLEHPKLVYVDPNPEPVFDLSGELIEPKKQIADKIFRHFVFGTEFLLGKNIRLRAAYNHMRRQELRSEGRSGLSGISFGLGVRVYRFYFDFGYVNYHAIGGATHFSLASNIGSWKKKE